MKTNLISIAKVAGVYTAIILGAGFASGQELLQYFVMYGNYGFAGFLFSGVVFAVVGWAVLDICLKQRFTDYRQLIGYLLGERLGHVTEYVIAAFLLVLFATMLAAGGAAMRQAYHMPFMAGVLGIGVLCLFTFLFDVNGIVKINAILAPFMLVGGIFIGLYAFLNMYVSSFSTHVQPTAARNWVTGATLYASYNIITAISVLASLHSVVSSKAIAKWGGILGGVCMTLLGICMALPLFLSYNQIHALQIPMLHIAQHYGKPMELLYLLILLAAIFTTAASNGFALLEWLAPKINVPSLMLKAGVVLVAVGFSELGFSTFVSSVYPIFGYVGFLEICLVLWGWYRCKNKRDA